jgi:hypothetical protein
MRLLCRSEKQIMRHIKKYLFCLLLIPMVISALESAYSKNIADYLDNNETMLQYEFTYGELTKMIGFYQSEAGKLLIKGRSKMTKSHKEKLNAYCNSAVGQKIIGKREVLSKEISKVSESWNRDLHETSISLLNNG